jgi:hypothetical protein
MVLKEYHSFPWVTVPYIVRANYYKTIINTTPPEINKGLKEFHGKYIDGFIMFEDMKYYDWFLLKFG